MFTIRALEMTATKARCKYPLVEIAATNSAIPLRPVDWANRWCTLTPNFENIYESVFKFEVRPEDVFVVTFMKCGTTWMQETAWLLMHDLNFETAKNVDLVERSLYLEYNGIDPLAEYNVPEICNNLPSPRLIKSHLPANLLPQQLWQKKPKIIYVARNVKDVVVSSYHFMKGMGMWSGTLNEYVEDFMNNNIVYTSFWAHIVDFWKMRNESFICFVTYEEMKHDLAAVIQKLCKFLDRDALNEDELKLMNEHLSFDNMKENKRTNLTDKIRSVNPETDESFEFMRRGIVGSYKDELTRVQQYKLDAWSRDFLSKHGISQKDIFGKF